MTEHDYIILGILAAIGFVAGIALGWTLLT